MGYEFSEDWFHWAPEVWERIVDLLPDRKNFVEVGSYEGRSTVWTVENMLADGGSILCIDTWDGGEEHKVGAINMALVEQRFDENMAKLHEKHPSRLVVKAKGTSYDLISKHIIGPGKPLDFVYIDGSHLSRDVITDACMLWPKLKPGGMLVFDDYLWGSPRDMLHRPKIAIDAFTTMFAEELSVIHVGYQFIVQKVK